MIDQETKMSVSDPGLQDKTEELQRLLNRIDRKIDHLIQNVQEWRLNGNRDNPGLEWDANDISGEPE